MRQRRGSLRVIRKCFRARATPRDDPHAENSCPFGQPRDGPAQKVAALCILFGRCAPRPVHYAQKRGGLQQEAIMLRSHKRLAPALGARNPVALFVAAAVVGGSLLVAWSVSQRIISGAPPILALWTTTLPDTSAATASVTTTFDVHAALRAAPTNAPVQNASAIGCTYVLIDGHRCD